MSLKPNQSLFQSAIGDASPTESLPQGNPFPITKQAEGLFEGEAPPGRDTHDSGSR